ncbi:hypothetical protein LTR37_004499 [Vermiconidia calcicola]|uniref:Uncharacterized protein n=1 Tax=Vermiconidia calcicola TaxID=1690605 RepID=A0ACC3NM01_9PEZI|nr:hypothetical protein LTR37_004499 [Vermiconidia calcicola]
MLPPTRVRQGIIQARRHTLASSTFKATATSVLATHQPRRSFWGRRFNNWSSQQDPSYQRCNRVRTMKTRAKLLRNIRRRGKWDGGGGRYRRPWYLNLDPEQKGDPVNGEGKGYELSHREKIWKEQMEAMRKKINIDPYEAIFGKRFEPFWGPLVPSWMREEMGLPVWKTRDTPKRAEPIETKKTQEEKATSSTQKPATEHKKIWTAKIEPKLDTAETKNPSSYAYSSSTSWNSRSNKTKRVEWDSVSGQTKQYEYDPVSNRMVQVEIPKPAEPKILEGTTPSAPVSDKTASNGQSLADRLSASNASSGLSIKVSDPKAVSLPVKPSTDLRKSIPIPPPLSQPSHSIPIGFSSTSMAVRPPGSLSVTPVISKPAAIAKWLESSNEVSARSEKEKDLDTLTADDVRASMPKLKAAAQIEPTKPTAEASSASPAAVLDSVLKERDLAKSKLYARNHTTEWDQAEMDVLLQKELDNLSKKKDKLLKDERGLFHIERQKRELQKLDQRMKEVVERVDKLNIVAATIRPEPSEPSAVKRAAAILQPSLDRMQTKKQLAKTMIEDADDAAAHESTEPFESMGNTVPKEWNLQADLLQADRINRTRGTRPLNSSQSTKMSDLFPKREAQPTKEQQRLASEKLAKDAERAAKLEKANAMLEAEIKENKFRMQAHENRYAHKIRSLRQELETAYKQSSVHSEKHLERVKSLEDELAKAQKTSSENRFKTLEERYAQKIKTLRSELDTAYKQSTVHSEKHMERIKALEEELHKAKKASGDTMPPAPAVRNGGARMVAQAEGDLAGNVPQFMDAGKWYKQATAKLSNKEMEKAAQKTRDQALVKEVREIYEKAYGTIDYEHRQPLPSSAQGEKAVNDKANAPDKKVRSVVEVESDVDLGEELAKYEKEQPQAFRYQRDQLENDIAVQERLAHEGVKLVDDKMPKLIPTQVANAKDPSPDAQATEAEKILWEEPPLYKVLAYDSGNDMMSTATTTSNWTGTETPISIPRALSELYQPARFVPYFAELQRDGYQVIFGTKDLLVFRKVKAPVVEAANVGLEDHGLIGNLKQTMAEMKRRVNPIDGTAGSLSERLSSSSITNDPAVQTSTEHTASASTNAQQQHAPAPAEIVEVAEDVDYRHYPRVRREEFPVFTGTRRKWNSNHRRHSKLSEERAARKERRRSMWKRVLGAGFGTATVMYFVGAAAEKSRAEELRQRRREGF